MKGFTLVELLAVIVILAVIALIATPIVLSIINDTKESAVIRSAEMYVGAVENKIMQENMKLGGKLNPKECIVGTDGNVTCDGTYLEIEVNGDKPDSGLITYDRGRVTGIELTFGDRKVITDTNGELVLETNLQVCKLISGEPNEISSKYECEVKPGTKYNFYVLSHEDDGTTNLIMERNICDDGTVATSDKPCYVAWVNQSDYYAYNNGIIPDDILYDSGVCELEGYCVFSNKGPITAMNYLNNATSTWSNIPNLNIIYEDEEGLFGEFEVTGKARLPYNREINQISCSYLVNLKSCLWLSEYLADASQYYGEKFQENPINEIAGYWLFMSRADYPGAAIIHNSIGEIDFTNVEVDDSYGVRPVINLKL